MSHLVLSEAVVARVQRVDWFSALGHAGDGVPGLRSLAVERVPTIEDAAAGLASVEWDDATAEAAAQLTVWLHQHAREAYRQWNRLVGDAKEVLERTALPAARALADPRLHDSGLVDCVAWDVLHAILEATYEPFDPPRFFGDLLAVYEAGHLPCGWNGTWPAGTLRAI